MILRSPTENENGGFPFVARMERGVIRISSFMHAVASATRHATFLDLHYSCQLFVVMLLRPSFLPQSFSMRHR